MVAARSIFIGIAHVGCHLHHQSCKWRKGRLANRPYGRLDGGCFQGNRSCRLSPTPPIMQMAVGAIRESSLRENGRRVFSGELQGLAPLPPEMKMCAGKEGQPQGLPLRQVCRTYFRNSDKDQGRVGALWRGLRYSISGMILSRLTGVGTIFVQIRWRMCGLSV